MYFDTSVSYESLALPLLLWGLAATVAASRAPKQPGLRYIAVVVLCAAALPMIHHLTTIMLCLILALLIVAGVVHSVRRVAAKDRGAPREHLWPLLLAASCLLVSIDLLVVQDSRRARRLPRPVPDPRMGATQTDLPT